MNDTDFKTRKAALDRYEVLKSTMTQIDLMLAAVGKGASFEVSILFDGQRWKAVSVSMDAAVLAELTRERVAVQAEMDAL